MTTIWHNPRCTKSRETLALLREKGIEPKVRLYLDNSPDVEELKDAAKELGLGPRDFIRKKEPAYKDYALGPESSDDELFAAMAAAPKLIERPIVFEGGRAALGRPPEAVLKLF